MATPTRLGGVIHTYQKYDPQRFPSPTQPPPDLVSPAMEHMLMFGSNHRLSDEELARAIRLDPSQISNLGPSLDALKSLLQERKRKILETYETDSVHRKSRQAYLKQAQYNQPPPRFRQRYEQAVHDQQIFDLERLWYSVEDDTSSFARHLVQLIERLGEQYEVEELIAKYKFTGRSALTIDEAIAVKQELLQIDELLEQLEQARETAQIGLIDMEALAELTEPDDLAELDALRQMVEDHVREMAARQGLEKDGQAFRLTPKAYRLFQGRLLQNIFSHLQASRSGRHQDAVVGEGAIEMQATKPYEFGDSITHMDIPQSFVNSLLRNGPSLPVRLKPEDIVVHRTRNRPQCATAMVMDMSGSMRYDGQYMNVKRMALAMEGLIRSEYPGDFLHFVEMYTFAKSRRPGEIIELMPKPVTIHDPVVQFKVDMSRPDISEFQIPPHFTNIQHGLQLARQLLSTQNTLNRQIILITDGLPTAHFDGHELYMLYPPHPLTEEATMREAMLCQRDHITINLFLVPSWSQSEEDIRFAYRMAESTRGRVFFTSGNDLDRYVVWDYVNRRREVVA